MRVAVVGTRTYGEYEVVKKVLDTIIKEDDIVVSGGAKGVDELAAKYAHERGLRLEVYEADWSTYGRKAGPLRNTEIVDVSDVIVAFWDHKSKGTLDTINKAKKRRKSLTIYPI